MTEFDPIAAAEAVSQPGTFSFMERLQGRNMPKDTVVVYLDEAGAYELKQLNKEHAKITEADDPRLVEIEARIAELQAQIASTRYTFYLEGIPSSDYDKIILKAREELPGEQKVTVNPITNEAIQYEDEYPERDDLINRRVWAAFIRVIEDPDGNRDENITEPVAQVLREKLPLAAQNRIARKIAELRMASDWTEVVQDESFFPTP